MSLGKAMETAQSSRASCSELPVVVGFAIFLLGLPFTNP